MQIEKLTGTPDQVHGRLLEGVHLAGYTFERACQHLEWLLDDDRWREVGAGYDNVNEFLAGIRLDEFRIVAEQRKRIARRIRELQPAASNRAIAKMVGVHHQTINNDAGEFSPAPETNGADAGGSQAIAGENSPPRLNVRVLQGRGHGEWYTPSDVIALARNVLGGIDLDPASSDEAQKVVQAANYITKDKDGLIQEWYGRVWLNPPCSQPLITNFITKLIEEYRAGRISAAIVLTHSYTSSAWFHEAASAADAICFTRGRVPFYDLNNKIANTAQGQIFFYFGNAVREFIRQFRKIGTVVPARFADDASDTLDTAAPAPPRAALANGAAVDASAAIDMVEDVPGVPRFLDRRAEVAR